SIATTSSRRSSSGSKVCAPRPTARCCSSPTVAAARTSRTTACAASSCSKEAAMFDLAEVGCVAPALALVDDEEPRHRPRLLAFVRGWSTSDLAHLRACMTQLDAELVVVCDDVAWMITPDHEPVFGNRVSV